MIKPITSRVTEREYTHGVITANARVEENSVDIQAYVQEVDKPKPTDLAGPQALTLDELDQLVCVLMAIRKDFWPQAQPICIGERQ